MKLTKQISHLLHVSVLFACYSLAGCQKNMNTKDTTELSASSSSNANISTLSTTGIGGYDLLSSFDKAIAFDYEHSGRLDYIVLYRPGSKRISIIKNTNGVFTPVYQSTGGIAGYNLDDVNDKIIAYDFEHTGRLDYLICYRPAKSAIWIIKNTNGVFTTVYKGAAGIGGFNLDNVRDLVMAYDYEHTGKADHLICYRPGSKAFWILKNTNGTFTPVVKSSNGVGGFDLNNVDDKIFAFDYEHSGKSDYLTPYRPRYKAVWIIKNTSGIFTPVFQSSNGIGGFNMDNMYDQAMAFDFEHSGKSDHVICYRPTNSEFWILRNNSGTFTPVVQSGDGIGGFKLGQAVDRVFAFDYEHSGKLDYLVAYRPGTGVIGIFKNTNGTFTQVF